jgi:hypothetical protein
MSEVAPLGVSSPPCTHCKFGLIVTGAGEREFVDRLFRSLSQEAGCSFVVLGKFGQRSPIGQSKTLKMVGQGKVIPDRDADQIGLPARRFLQGQPCHFVIVLDDVEHDRRPHLAAIFARYRKALDTILRVEDRPRASVHFLANMLEAYYFADSSAVNAALGTTILNSDYPGDVESIRHPKSDLKHHAAKCNAAFDEKADGGKILDRLNLNHVLSQPRTCEYLRSLIAWCVRQLQTFCPIWDNSIVTRYQIMNGVQAKVTKGQ